MSDISIIRKSGSWSALGKELRKRTVDPISHFSFVAYFLLAVFAVGGTGVWLELYSYLFLLPKDSINDSSLVPLRTAVITFFPALAGAASLQLIWAEDNQKFLRAFAVLILFFLTIVALAIAPTAALSHSTALIIGVVSSVIALWTWWIANAKQQDLLDPDAPLGKKDPEAELAGNLNGFKV